MRSSSLAVTDNSQARRRFFATRRHRVNKAPRTFNRKGFSLELLEQRQLLTAQPVITEFMASNQSTLDDGDGSSSDWIEVHNAGSSPADLTGYHLTDAASELDKWTFPSTIIDPGGFLIVFASGQSTDNYVDASGNPHTNFKLDSEGEYLALVAPDNTIVSEYGNQSGGYPAQLRDVSYGIAQTVSVVDADTDASYAIPLDDAASDWTMPGFDAAANGYVEGKASFGFETRPENRTNFVDQFVTEVPSSAHAIRARMEFDLADASAISAMTLQLKYDNGFVAYLNGQEVARDNVPDNVSWFSTAPANSPRDSAAMEFAEFPLNEHTDKLVTGKNVLAFQALNNRSDDSDFLLVPELVLGTVDMQAAFGQETVVGFMETPTPGQPNVASNRIRQGYSGNVEISVDSGYYDSALQVELANDTEGATVYYTTDSSRPTPENGTVYTDPITIDTTTVLRAAAFVPGFIEGKIASNTYLFLDDILTQDGEGLPETWGVLGSGCNNSGAAARRPARANYDMDRRVVEDARYADTIRDDLKSVPIISLVLDPEDLWSEERGIYSNPLSEGFNWERPVSIELLNTDGETEFDVDAGLRIHGGWGRCPSQTNKHSMRVVFRDDYGDTKLRYPMFGEDATDSFDTFVLRANFNHSWATGDGTNTTFVNDLFAATTQREMGWVAPRGYYVHLYLNGLYWGIYNPMERPSAPFAADYFGGDKDDYDVIVVNAATDGDMNAWRELRNRARSGDYDAVKEMLDIDAAIDYFIVNQYGGNWDWPQNNWYGSRNKADNGKWYFHSWDAEGMFGRGLAENRVNQTGNELGGLIGELRRIDEFRVRYADRIQKHFFNGGLLTPEANIDRLNRITAPIDRAVVGESARWGDGSNNSGRPRTRDDNWLPALQNLRENYFPERGKRVLDQFRQVDLFPNTAAPEFNRYGGPVQEGFEVTMANPNGGGVLYYTLDGTDPRVEGGEVAPGALVHGGEAIKVDDDLQVLARVRSEDGEWSPIIEAQFVVTGLRITEVNYHPHDANLGAVTGEAAVDNELFEFIELANTGTEGVDLTGANFTQGVSFDFEDNFVLAGGARTVIVNDTEAFQSRYGDNVSIAGEFAGDFSDFGEIIELQDATGKSLARVAYQVSGDWPERANGDGSSLEMIDPLGAISDPANWRASSEVGGSPGSVGTGPQAGVVISEVLGHGESAEEDMLELYNSGSTAIDISNWFIGTPGSEPFRFQLPASTTIPAGGYLVKSEAELGFEFNIGLGDRVWLVEADDNGVPRRIATEASFGPSLAGVSIGDIGNNNWRPLAETTIGGPNAGPRPSDVVISEVQFAPTDLDGDGGQRLDNFEFAELYNTTDQTIDISGWKLSGDLALVVPDDTMLEPDKPLPVVRFSANGSTPTVFRFVYGMDLTAPLLSRYRSRLPDDEGSIVLERPSDAPGQADPDNLMLVDEVAWGTSAKWPTGATNTGMSFNRISPTSDGRLPSSWTVVEANPGSVDFTVRIPGDSNEDGQFNQLDIVAVLQSAKYLTGQPASFAEGDWNGDGLFNQLDIVAALQGGQYLAGENAIHGLEQGIAKADQEELVSDDDTRVRLHDEAFSENTIWLV